MSIEELEARIPKVRDFEGRNVYLTLELDPFELDWVAEYKDDNYEVVGEGTMSALGETISKALENLLMKLSEDNPQPIAQHLRKS